MKIAELLILMSISLTLCYGNPRVRVVVSHIKRCTQDTECFSHQKCAAGMCINICNVNKHLYPSDAICRVIDHDAEWTDGSGYAAEPAERIKKQCMGDNECPHYQKCSEGGCTFGCKIDKYSYATNAHCRAVNHTAIWSCPSGYYGDPKEMCRRYCAGHTDCATTDLCIDDVCVPGCDTIAPSCHYSGVCYPRHHNPHCVTYRPERQQQHREHMESLERRGEMNIGVLSYLWGEDGKPYCE